MRETVFTTSNYRIWYLWIFFLNSVSSTPPDIQCIRPNMYSWKLPLTLYQGTITANITIYHCSYYREDVCEGEICNNCNNDQAEYPTIGKLTHRYSHITHNCLRANLHPKDEQLPSNYTLFSDSYSCDNNSKIHKKITFTMTKYETMADLGQDIVVLRSGTVCRYSMGFCHDAKENIDVMWETTVKYNFSCDRLKKVRTLNIDYFVLKSKRYALIESYDKYFALELKAKEKTCGLATWTTPLKEVIITEGVITSASNSPLDVLDHWQTYFRDKQLLYDFLNAECTARLNENSTKSDALLGKFMMIDQFNYLNDQQRFYQFKLEVSVYLALCSALCFLCGLIYVSCCRCKNKSCICECKVSRYCMPERETEDVSVIYDYIK